MTVRMRYPAGEAIAMILKGGACQGRENAAEGMGQEQHPGRTQPERSSQQATINEERTVFCLWQEKFLCGQTRWLLCWGVSKPYAYKLIKKLNEKLEKTGCLTMAGRIDRKFFYDQFYGTREGKEI